MTTTSGTERHTRASETVSEYRELFFPCAPPLYEEPLVLSEGRGTIVHDVDGNEYIDYVASWGPLIAGHAHPRVVEAVWDAAARGMSFGAPTEIETRLGELVSDRVTGIDKVRFVSSGTEAGASPKRSTCSASRAATIVSAESNRAVPAPVRSPAGFTGSDMLRDTSSNRTRLAVSGASEHR